MAENSLADSLNNFASWATETRTAAVNLRDTISPPKKMQTVEAQDSIIRVGEYGFDWRILAGAGAVLIALLVIKLTLTKKG